MPVTERRREHHRGRLVIDVEALLRDLPTATNANLVTRPTGRAVREAIEAELDGAGRQVTVSMIDLRGVRVLDFSCADEVVAGLLLRYLPPDRPSNVFFLFRAVEEVHGHAVGEVLARHRLAAVCDYGEGGWSLQGPTTLDELAIWTALEHRQRIGAGTLASLLDPRSDAVLQRLSERRVACFDPEGGVSSLSALAPPPLRHPAETPRDVRGD